jgi:hypothetical protein
MAQRNTYAHATRAAENLLDDEGITELPVRPIDIAKSREITVQPMSVSSNAFSGVLMNVGDVLGIGYATHIDNEGFKRFSIGHELGHYFLEGHCDHLLPMDGKHESRAGFHTGDKYEMEADHFSAGLLMPRKLFKKAIDQQRTTGLKAVQALSDLCITSLTATAIQYAKHSPDQIAIVLSTGRAVDYCFMSDTLKELRGLEWIKKGTLLPRTTTYTFNQDEQRVRAGAYEEGSCNLDDWFGGPWDAELIEEVVGLGAYGKTLTVLSTTEFLDQEELDEDEEIEESWTPRFRR